MVGICLIGKCHGRHLSDRQMTWSAFVYLQSGFVRLLIVLVGICLDRQMSWSGNVIGDHQMSRSANVSMANGRQMSCSANVMVCVCQIGKCWSANVGLQMSGRQTSVRLEFHQRQRARTNTLVLVLKNNLTSPPSAIKSSVVRSALLLYITANDLV